MKSAIRNHPIPNPLRILVCSIDLEGSACGAIRLVGPLGRNPGVELRWYRHTSFLQDLEWASLVLVQRAFPASERMRHLKAVFRSKKPLVYETDDIFAAVPIDHPNAEELRTVAAGIQRTLKHCHALVVSTANLASQMQTTKPTFVLENALDETLWEQIAPPETEVPLRIVFAGTQSHQEDLTLCQAALERILAKYGDRVEILLMGCSTPGLGQLAGVKVFEFTRNYAAYARTLQGLHAHIGIAPLRDTDFNRAKSAIKWLEMSACGIAGIYTDLPPYKSVVQDGRNGVLAGQKEEDWFQALDRLICDPSLRRSLAVAAQRDTYREHTVAARAPLYGKLLLSILRTAIENGARSGRVSRWVRFLFWIGV